MPVGWYGLICGICFRGLTPDTCYVDSDGQKWDICPGLCAQQAGLMTIEGNDDGPQVWRVTRTWYVEADRATDALELTQGIYHSESQVLAVPTPPPGIPVIRP